jgi:hypothetical protein
MLEGKNQFPYWGRQLGHLEVVPFKTLMKLKAQEDTCLITMTAAKANTSVTCWNTSVCVCVCEARMLITKVCHLCHLQQPFKCLIFFFLQMAVWERK